MILLPVLSLAIGLLLGLLGGGGSILTVPMLVYLFDIPVKNAILTSFAVVGVSSLAAVARYAGRGQVCWKSGLFFGLSGMGGSFLGGRVGAVLPDHILMALFGLLALATGIVMLVKAKRTALVPALAMKSCLCPLHTAYPRVLFDGFLVGVVTGMVGVGAGFLIVPVLTLLVGLPTPAAIGTSLMILVMNAMAGFAGQATLENPNLELIATVTTATLTGAVLGAQLSVYFGGALLRRLFGVFVVTIAGYILFQTLDREFRRDITELLYQHSEFFLGIGSVAAFYALLRFGVWIHAVGGHAPPFEPARNSKESA